MPYLQGPRPDAVVPAALRTEFRSARVVDVPAAAPRPRNHGAHETSNAERPPLPIRDVQPEQEQREAPEEDRQEEERAWSGRTSRVRLPDGCGVAFTAVATTHGLANVLPLSRERPSRFYRFCRPSSGRSSAAAAC